MRTSTIFVLAAGGLIGYVLSALFERERRRRRPVVLGPWHA